MLRLLAFFVSTTLGFAGEVLSWKQLPSLPDSLGVAGAFAGVSDGRLLVAGGANFPGKMPWEGGKKVWHDTVWVLDRPEGSWREVGRLRRPLAYGVCISHRDGVVCVGGSDSERHYSDVFRLRVKGSALAIEPLPSLPVALAGAAGALVGDTLFIACGSEKPGELEATNRAFALDLATTKGSWRELPPLPAADRLFATGAAHDGAFYVIGGAALEAKSDGKAARVYLRETWSYRDATGWQRMADLPRPSVAAASPAPCIDGVIQLFGGDDGSLVGFQPLDRHPGFPRRVLTYDCSFNLWSEAGESPAPRATLPCAEWLGAFVLPSGEVRPGVRSVEVWSVMKR